MLKNRIRYVFLPCSMWFGQYADHDKVNLGSEPQQHHENETGWDRLKRMFEIEYFYPFYLFNIVNFHRICLISSEFGNLSKEVVTVLHVGAMSSFVGALYGGVLHSRTAYMDFIRNNQATAFENHFEAKKKLQDKVTISFGKGAFKWAWRLSLFCSTFVGISTAISVYRDKCGIVEYVAAGTLSGSLYKLKLGPRGWLVGGGLGAGLGLIAGCATSVLLMLSGLTMEDLRGVQYNLQKQRTDYINKGIADFLEKEESEIIVAHSKRLGESGKNLENIEKQSTC